MGRIKTIVRPILISIQVAIVLSLVGIVAYRSMELPGVLKRSDCHANQKALDDVVWKVCNDLRRETVSVETAYLVERSVDGRPETKLVIVFAPRGEDRQPSAIAVDPTGYGYSRAAHCPDHNVRGPIPVIDYWYMFGSWRCLYDGRHN